MAFLMILKSIDSGRGLFRDVSISYKSVRSSYLPVQPFPIYLSTKKKSIGRSNGNLGNDVYPGYDDKKTSKYSRNGSRSITKNGNNNDNDDDGEDNDDNEERNDKKLKGRKIRGKRDDNVSTDDNDDKVTVDDDPDDEGDGDDGKKDGSKDRKNIGKKQPRKVVQRYKRASNKNPETSKERTVPKNRYHKVFGKILEFPCFPMIVKFKIYVLTLLKRSKDLFSMFAEHWKLLFSRKTSDSEGNSSGEEDMEDYEKLYGRQHTEEYSHQSKQKKMQDSVIFKNSAHTINSKPIDRVQFQRRSNHNIALFQNIKKYDHGASLNVMKIQSQNFTSPPYDEFDSKFK